MPKVSKHVILQLAEGARINWDEDEQAYVFLYPEGMAILEPPISNILICSDGQLSVQEVVATLRLDLPCGFNDRQIRHYIDQLVEHGWLQPVRYQG